MKYSFLGNTDALFSGIGLGTVALGMTYANQPAPDYAVSAKLLNMALDSGINFIDTARTYGISESVIGQALATRRDEYYLCTKIRPLSDETNLRVHIAQSLAESLRDLRTDHLDVVYLHNVDMTDARHLAMADYLRAYSNVRYVGATLYGMSNALAAIQSGLFDLIQIGYSVIDRRVADDVLYMAELSGVGIIARSVLLRGMLMAKAIPESLAGLAKAIVELRGIAQSQQMSLLELAYRYMVDKTPFLIGARNTNELQLALNYTQRGPLSANLTRRIERVIIPQAEQLEPRYWNC